MAEKAKQIKYTNNEAQLGAIWRARTALLDLQAERRLQARPAVIAHHLMCLEAAETALEIAQAEAHAYGLKIETYTLRDDAAAEKAVR